MELAVEAVELYVWDRAGSRQLTGSGGRRGVFAGSRAEHASRL